MTNIRKFRLMWLIYIIIMNAIVRTLCISAQLKKKKYILCTHILKFQADLINSLVLAMFTLYYVGDGKDNLRTHNYILYIHHFFLILMTGRTLEKRPKQCFDG